MSGPFIVTHSRLPEQDGATGCVLSKRAVAGLDDAQSLAYEIVQCEWRYGPAARRGQPDYEDGRQWARSLGVGGGSFVLPDGSEVRVRARVWGQLSREAGRFEVEYGDGGERPRPADAIGSGRHALGGHRAVCEVCGYRSKRFTGDSHSEMNGQEQADGALVDHRDRPRHRKRVLAAWNAKHGIEAQDGGGA